MPGTLTTAFLALKLYDPDADYVVMPFDRSRTRCRTARCEAGLLIHEGQLTYQDEGLKKIVDLGEWWAERTQRPAAAARRQRHPPRSRAGDDPAGVARCCTTASPTRLDHRQEALDYALQFGRGLDRTKADRFVGMYVNELTLDYGDRGRAAVQRLMDEAWKQRLIPKPITVEFSA